MITLADPVVTEGAIFLRDNSRAEFLHRLPPAPALLLAPGGPALQLTLYRYSLEDPSFGSDRGGGVLLMTLDFGTLPREDAEAQTRLPSDAPPEVSLPPVSAGKLRLWMGGEEVFSETIPETPRPILPVALPLTVFAAGQMHSASQQGRPILYATAEGTLLLNYDGPPFQVRTDQSKAVQYLSSKGASFSAVDVAAVLMPALIELGAVRIEVAGEPGAAPMLGSALAAGWLLEPEPESGETWSAIPGIAPPPLHLRGKLRVRRALTADRSAQIGGAISTVQVPWFAAAPIGPPPHDAIHLLDLEDTTVVRVRASGVQDGVAKKFQDLGAEFEFPGGLTATVTFRAWDARGLSESHTVRFLRAADGSDAYRWRLFARAGANSIFGDWQTSTNRMLLLNFNSVKGALGLRSEANP